MYTVKIGQLILNIATREMQKITDVNYVHNGYVPVLRLQIDGVWQDDCVWHRYDFEYYRSGK